jgi:hypothetical protein
MHGITYMHLAPLTVTDEQLQPLRFNQQHHSVSYRTGFAAEHESHRQKPHTHNWQFHKETVPLKGFTLSIIITTRLSR